MRPKYASNVRGMIALLGSGCEYWLTIFPRARREINRSRCRARAISDPRLRAHALHKLDGERLNPEAAAFFAVLAPRRRRARLVSLIVKFQIAYDYLDAINEEPDTASLQNGLQLHTALIEAVSGSQPPRDSSHYYLHHPHGHDDGYLAELVRECSEIVHTLPAADSIAPVLRRAAARCGEAQAHNHAVLIEGDEQLIQWAASQRGADAYLWWELAAAGISCLAVHALLAAAATTGTTEQQAEQIDAAYYPSVCAISALLDSLVDLPDDDVAGINHSFVSHYPNYGLTAQRFATIAAEARLLSRRLRKRSRHAVVICGIASFYLSAPEARSERARVACERTLDSLGATTTPMLAAMRLRRGIG